jgi:hypothetical protein
MRKLPVLITLFLVLFVSAAYPQTSNLVRTNLSAAEVDRIVRTFTKNELLFREALQDYVFNRFARVDTIGMGGQITGSYIRDSFMTFTHDGQRFERIEHFPIPSVPAGFVTPEDLEDLGGVTPFALEPRVINEYNFTFLGKEKIDELDLYVFDVAPKITPDPKKTKQRYFIGRIWVDDRDLMIVKAKGKAIPETKTNKFPVVETWRENVDGKYWFPSYASSDDELVFENGNVQKIKLRIKYTDYKLGRTDVKVIGEDEAPPKP